MRGLVVCFVGGEGEVQGLGWFGEERGEGDSRRRKNEDERFSRVFSTDRDSFD